METSSLLQFIQLISSSSSCSSNTLNHSLGPTQQMLSMSWQLLEFHWLFWWSYTRSSHPVMLQVMERPYVCMALTDLGCQHNFYKRWRDLCLSRNSYRRTGSKWELYTQESFAWYWQYCAVKQLLCVLPSGCYWSLSFTSRESRIVCSSQ